VFGIPNEFFLGGVALQTKGVFVVPFVEKGFFNPGVMGGMTRNTDQFSSQT
jgi:hypothetical protein